MGAGGSSRQTRCLYASLGLHWDLIFAFLAGLSLQLGQASERKSEHPLAKINWAGNSKKASRLRQFRFAAIPAFLDLAQIP
jgi:hypothetical protein